MPKLDSSMMEFVDENDVCDELVSIPAAAVEYIESCVREGGCLPAFHFEVIEFFFEWLAAQDKTVQRDVLRAGLINGRKVIGSGRSVY